jgi:serine/threonine-protein kinase
VVKALDAGRDGESHFLVMEYVPGQTLGDLIASKKRLKLDEACSIAAAVALGLEAAHARGVVHRDFSPQNVIIARDGTVKVTDFGVARDLTQTSMTATSMVLGKPHYIAPEVVTGRTRADIRGDIYALGIVLYQMLAGEVPFAADTPWNIMQRHVSEAPPPLHQTRADVSAWLSAVVARCLAKNPSERYQTPAALAAALIGRGAPAQPSLDGAALDYLPATMEDAAPVSRPRQAVPSQAPRTPARGAGRADRRVLVAVVGLMAVAAIGLVAAVVLSTGKPQVTTAIGIQDVPIAPTAAPSRPSFQPVCFPTTLMAGRSTSCTSYYTPQETSREWSAPEGLPLSSTNGSFQATFATEGEKTVSLNVCIDGSCTTNSTTVTVLPLLDRTSCAQISGTVYRSESERQWYLQNCVNQ